MNLKEFSSLVEALKFNFGFKIEGDGSDKWLDILFNIASGFSEQDIKYGFNEMFKMTNKKWSEQFKIPYGSPPSIGVWIEFFSLKKKHQANCLISEDMRMRIVKTKDRLESLKPKSESKIIEIKDIQKLIKNIRKSS